MKTSVELKYFGRWNYSNENVGVVYFYSPLQLSNEESQGLVLGGWAYKGWENKTLYKINVEIITKAIDGNFAISTSRYIQDPSTNGSGSVLVYDFNNDGMQDIFLAAHNESPTVPTASTAFISRADGIYDKLKINDSVEAHSASLGTKEGIPTIVSAGYGPKDSFYQYNLVTKSFDVKEWAGTHSGSLYGSCATIADLDNDGKSELIIGDCKTGPGIEFVDRSPTKLAIYKINGNILASVPSYSTTLYFDQSKYQNQNLISEFGGLTHNYRVWTDDFNNDGKLDILLGVGVWSSTVGWQRSKIQLLQNEGEFKFKDVTENNGSAYNENSSFVDYSMQMVDIDNSGIKTLLLAGDPAANINTERQSNYILLNDGTGKLYAALHTQYSNYSNEINQFIPLLNKDKSISFIGVSKSYDLYSLDISYNPTRDFNENISIVDRNNSKIIRTWAGNDVIYDTNANLSSTKIDGGFGIDRAVYSQAREKYSTLISADSIHIKGAALDDTLLNIERIKFSDKIIAFDIQGNAGQAYRLYKAALDRTPDPNGLAGWIKYMDDGSQLTSMAQQFIDSQEFRTKYGSLDNTGFVNQLYINVLARKGEAAGVEGWVNGLANGLSRAQVLAGFSESSENQANVIGQIKDGIAYNEWWLV